MTYNQRFSGISLAIFTSDLTIAHMQSRCVISLLSQMDFFTCRTLGVGHSQLLTSKLKKNWYSSIDQCVIMIIGNRDFVWNVCVCYIHSCGPSTYRSGQHFRGAGIPGHVPTHLPTLITCDDKIINHTHTHACMHARTHTHTHTRFVQDTALLQ